MNDFDFTEAEIVELASKRTLDHYFGKYLKIIQNMVCKTNILDLKCNLKTLFDVRLKP